MGLVIAADTGGTFTDLVTLSADGEALSVAKALTTYDAPMRGLMACADQVQANFADADFFIEGALEEWEPCERGRAVSHSFCPQSNEPRWLQRR